MVYYAKGKRKERDGEMKQGIVRKGKGGNCIILFMPLNYMSCMLSGGNNGK